MCNLPGQAGQPGIRLPLQGETLFEREHQLGIGQAFRVDGSAVDMTVVKGSAVDAAAVNPTAVAGFCDECTAPTGHAPTMPRTTDIPTRKNPYDQVFLWKIRLG